mmetsp:Transcript_16878/g.26858  ORF Transcript_16878/g.26858 Transcript_16878/m.26858 type:complete len:271 (+) Transcript_16878:495-1307(+)
MRVIFFLVTLHSLFLFIFIFIFILVCSISDLFVFVFILHFVFIIGFLFALFFLIKRSYFDFHLWIIIVVVFRLLIVSVTAIHRTIGAHHFCLFCLWFLFCLCSISCISIILILVPFLCLFLWFLLFCLFDDSRQIRVIFINQLPASGLLHSFHQIHSKHQQRHRNQEKQSDVEHSPPNGSDIGDQADKHGAHPAAAFIRDLVQCKHLRLSSNRHQIRKHRACVRLDGAPVHAIEEHVNPNFGLGHEAKWTAWNQSKHRVHGEQSKRGDMY